MTNPLRRLLLRQGVSVSTLLALSTAGLLQPLRVLASTWPQEQFTATRFDEALKRYGATEAKIAAEITIAAPDIAENGANVPIEVSSRLPDTRTLAIFAEKNPMPLVATFRFDAGTLPYVKIPLKLAESMRVRVVAQTADGRHHYASREIRVTVGGCGG